LPRTRSAFESRTQVWREVGLGSEIDRSAARRGRGGAVVAAALIAAVPDPGAQRSPDPVHRHPLREPERVEFRARFEAATSPREVQRMIEGAIDVPLRYPPHIAVEELDRNDVVVRIVTTPMNPRDGATLAEQVLSGLRNTNGAHA
ncbi:MAG TPA: hypothetical protein VH501_07610, partial [Solirubrobacterales bacterium]